MTDAGVPVRLTVNRPNPSAVEPCHSYLVEVLPGNTGKVYIGDSPGMNVALMEHVLVWLPPPTANTAPSYNVTISSAPNALSVQDRYLDVETDGEGVLVSIAVN